MEKIVVEPPDAGWAVRTDAIASTMVFRSGSAAEEAARGLAIRLARAGEPVKLHLKLRNSAAEARFVRLPPLEPGATPNLVTIPDVRTPEHEGVQATRRAQSGRSRASVE
ncbi:hypothetical protein [Brevundimonas goettingensis]|uniref:DUF2188 domain-containing protein n=1 Tax=Brevundimonas goettingensis TaxID=2774190 RepID=A0A975C4K8_9CAUL|nr:hypothetical protein [Brevundimonas goettingensis]QTC92777.1 hypothetical protein IFJ75_07970 [Brevundimonas goettingensis]